MQKLFGLIVISCALLFSALAHAAQPAASNGNAVTLPDAQGRLVTVPLSSNADGQQQTEATTSSTCTTYSTLDIAGNVVGGSYYQWGSDFSFNCTGTPSARFTLGSGYIWLQQLTSSGWVTVAGPSSWVGQTVSPGTYRWVVMSFTSQYVSIRLSEPVF